MRIHSSLRATLPLATGLFFLLACGGSSGGSKNQGTSGPAAPTITSFTASAPVVPFNGSASLACTADAAGGTLTLDGEPLSVQSPVTVHPRNRQTYVLKAANATGSVSKSATIAARGQDLLAGTAGGFGYGDSPRSDGARFHWPTGLAIDAAGNLIVGDSMNNTIRRIAADGAVTTVGGKVKDASATADGLPLSETHFEGSVDGAATDGQGHLFLIQHNYGVPDGAVLRRVDPDGTAHILAGLPAPTFPIRAPQPFQRGEQPGLAKYRPSETVRAFREAWAAAKRPSQAFTGPYDGQGTSAQFLYPQDIATDAAGNVYVADGGSHRIAKVAADGTVTTIAGDPKQSPFDRGANRDGRGEEAQFDFPCGLWVNPAGDLIYVADLYAHLIRRITIDKDGNAMVDTVAGQKGSLIGYKDGPVETALLGEVTDVLVDNRTGDLLFTEAGHVDPVNPQFNHGLVRRIHDGVVSTFAGRLAVELAGQRLLDYDGQGTHAQFFVPWRLVQDAAGNCFVTDRDLDTIRKITPGGLVSTAAGDLDLYYNVDGKGRGALFASPQGIAVNKAGLALVVDPLACVVRTVAPDGTVTTLAGAPGLSAYQDGKGTEGRFINARRVAFLPTGEAIVADTLGCLIRKVDLAGNVTTFAGTGEWTGNLSEGPVLSTPVFPVALGVAPDGTIYFSDGRTIYTIANGQIAWFAGTRNGDPMDYAVGPADKARFSQISSFAFGQGGDVYVADEMNQVILRITRDASGAATVSLLTGQPWHRGRTDGTPDIASFANPSGLAIDAQGNLFVADRSNHLLRRVSPAGEVSSVSGDRNAPSLWGFTPPTGTSSGSLGTATLESPVDVAITPNGDLLVTSLGSIVQITLPDQP